MKINRPYGWIAGVVAVALGLGIGTAVADGPASPSQADATSALQTLQAYVSAHPDAPVATAPPATSTAPPTTVPATPPPTTTVPPTTTPAPTTTSPASTRASGMPWSDGVWAMHDATRATDFAAWRGRPIDNVSAFVSRETWTNLLSNWWPAVVPSSFVKTRDDFVLGVPLWTDDGQAGTDAQWMTLSKQIAAVDPDAYVRLGWEMNCCFSKATNATTWRAQFSRASTLLKATSPKLRIVFNPNEGASGSGLVADPRTLFVDGKADVIGIDAYDWYSPYTTLASQTDHFTKAYGWNFWYDFAQSKGLPFALPEFGVYTASTASGGDDPAYINSVYAWLAQKAQSKPGSIAFVTYFNESAAYCKCNVYPTTPNPQAAAAYRTQINALAH